ncbi:MAG: bifunctional acetaldehyde-CoA/alcohol dehydrogenase [Deltaproteobacteria bacterium]|jgi:acetaldehyde dehydrogenase/alcohol dehydrogenase|nr:bifunctional acetaldehyde-CoA/alcohol dehydrogenase [Deltaproteobacteria bacterium]
MAKNLQDLDKLIANAKEAQRKFATFTQEQVDAIFKAACLAGNKARIPLAKMAVAETGMGIVEDKVIKNHYAAEYLYYNYIGAKTCGVIEEDKSGGMRKIAEPLGVIAGVVPTTNPTSTAIFKALLAIKTRNALLLSPHPRAPKCTLEAAEIIHKAAVAAGAPQGILGGISEPTIELSQALMGHKDIDIILATGGPGMVKAAYSSGHPALGVGQGNTPAVIDETADIPMAVNSILLSKTFDNGMICASEQSVIVVEKVYEEVKAEFLLRGAYFLNKNERQKVGETIVIDGRLNAKIVGQSAHTIANMSGISVPESAKVLIGEVTDTVPSEPFAHEKLSPVLAMYKAADFKDACDKAYALLSFQGMGHTSLLFTEEGVEERVKYFSERMHTGRILINQPSSFGAIGDVFNFRLVPSLTLGCGSWGGNAVSENVGIKQLVNIKTVTERRYNMLWFRVPPRIYFRPGCLPVAFKDLTDSKRAFLVTDGPLAALGYAKRVTDVFESYGITYQIYSEVKPDPTLTTIYDGLKKLREFKPDLVVALGGGSPMDAAKVMWAMYEDPDLKFEDLAARFMDIRKRVYAYPENKPKQSKLICITTTSGTGSEVTPFSVVTDDATGKKYPLADYGLTPYMSIIDPDFVAELPPSQITFGGIDALSHAIEAFTSILANEFSDGLALEATRMIFEYLPDSFKKGPNYKLAREKMHYAATLAGMAFANEFLGICHSLAHKMGAKYHVPHGLANAFLLTHVMQFNRVDNPRKQAAFPQYRHPNITDRFARIADYLGLGGKNKDDKVDKLIAAIEKLKAEVGVPPSIKAWGRINEEEFMAGLDALSEEAFDDQCTGGNPRYPSFEELKQVYINAWYGGKAGKAEKSEG